MRKHLKWKELLSAVAIAATMGCSTNTHDSVQTNSPAPAPMRGASLSAPGVSSAGPASWTTPNTEALAIAAANANRGGRFLGYIEGSGASPSGNVSPLTGLVLDPALRVPNPQITVNSSTSSGPHPIVVNDAGGGGVFVGAATTGAVTSAAVTSAPITAAATTSATTNTAAVAPVITTPSTVATPTNTASALSVGQFAAGAGTSAAATTAIPNNNTGALTPTVSSAAIPSPNVAANPPVTLSNTNRATTTTPATTAAAKRATSSNGSVRATFGPAGMTSSSSKSTASSNAIRVTSANGRTVISNVP